MAPRESNFCFSRRRAADIARPRALPDHMHMRRAAALALALLVAGLANADCGGEPVSGGQCVPYTGVCSPIIGNYLFVNDTYPISTQEDLVYSALKSIRQNRGIVSDDCEHATDWFACASVMLPCVDSGGPGGGIPLLPCDSDCASWWTTCGSVFTTYLTTVLGGKWQNSLSLLCVNGLFTDAGGHSVGQPDVFGDRMIPGQRYYPFGYNGTLRFPLDATPYTYNFANGSSVSEMCYHPTRPSANVTLAIPVEVTCIAPLQNGLDANNESTCVVPCPFPVFTDDEINQVQLAYIVPGCLALAFCVFVLLDSIWVIFEYTGGLQWRRLRKYILWSSGGSSTEDSAVVSSGSSNAFRRRPIQATTIYTLVGSIIGIVYFCLGPLPSLLFGASVSCGGQTGFAFSNIAVGKADLSGITCRAQRFAPFMLQLLFNLILFTIVKVLEVVSDRYRKLSGRSKLMLTVTLHFYCWAIPVIFLIAAGVTDQLSLDINTALEQIIRQSSICLFRFDNPNTEIVLIYLPFIITGVLVSGLSVHVLLTINRVRDKVAGTANAKNTETELAMRLLILRLAGLGLGTFVVLIVLMITTSLFENEVNTFAPLWESWFECLDTAFSCNIDSCQTFINQALQVRPTATLMATQLASTSCISLLFSAFFAAQSLARLLKEYRNGQLGAKWRALVTGTHQGSSVQESVRGDKRVAGSEMPASSFNTRVETVAAYHQEM